MMATARELTQEKLNRLATATPRHAPSQKGTVGDRIEEMAARHPERPFGPQQVPREPDRLWRPHGRATSTPPPTMATSGSRVARREDSPDHSPSEAESWHR